MFPALMTLAVPRAEAQQGQWAGSVNFSGTSTSWKNGQKFSSPWPAQGPVPVPSQVFAAGDIIELEMSGRITYTLTWVDQNGMPTTNPPPPNNVYIIEIGIASWYYTPDEAEVYVISHSADDGLGDPEIVQGAAGASSGRRFAVLSGATGTITFFEDVSASLAFFCTSGYGFTEAQADYGFLLTAPSDNYHFGPYLQPPPVGTTPHGQTAANNQTMPLADGTGYYIANRVYHNETAHHARDRLKETAIFFAFGHGGNQFQSAQTFWNGSWGALVQKAGARDQLIAQGMQAGNIVWTDDPAIPANAFKQVLLAVFLGCWTAYYTELWGSPVDGVISKGADFAMGWTTVIKTHGFYDGQWRDGAEEYSDRLWEELKLGKKLLDAHNLAASITVPAMGLHNQRIVPHGNMTIHPSRYGVP